MECNKLFKEALSGIDFRYKMDDVINDVPNNQKFKAKQLEGYLLKRGVSPKEIKANSLFSEVNPDELYTAKEWKVLNDVNGKQKLTQRDLGTNYNGISLNKKGYKNPTYKETGDIIEQELQHNVPTPHYSEKLKPTDNPFSSEYLVGHRRVHIDEVNGKPTTVLNEFQSDWAQAERSGEGNRVFAKNHLSNDDLFPIREKRKQLIKESTVLRSKINEYFNSNKEPSKEIIDIGKNLKAKEKEIETLNNKLYQASMDERDIVADFPMNPVKYQQYQIVRTIDEAIKNGTNRIAIPIDRVGEMYGTEGVTKFYENLNPTYKSALKSIRKQADNSIRNLRNKGLPKEIFEAEANKIRDKVRNKTDDLVNKYINNSILPTIRKKLEKQGMKLKLTREEYSGGKENNQLHIIEIVKKPNHKVKWDVYGMLGALGLSELGDKLKNSEKQKYEE